MGVTGDEVKKKIAIQGIETMENFYHSIGMPINFHELGIHPNKQEIREWQNTVILLVGTIRIRLKN